MKKYAISISDGHNEDWEYFNTKKETYKTFNILKKTEDYFNKELIPLIIETAGNDGVFKTDTAKYKLYEKAWRSLNKRNYKNGKRSC